MKKVLLYIGVALAVILLLCFAGLYWLLETSSGARFVLTAGSGLAGVDLSVARVEGTLWDRLKLRGVQLKERQLTAQVDTLYLSWDPGRLLDGELLVHQLVLSGVRVQDNAPSKALQLRWPQVSPFVRRFSAKVEKFRLAGLNYRHLQAAPVLVNELSATLAFRDGLLTLSDLSLSAPQGRAKGELALGLGPRSLRVDLSATPATPVQGMDLFSLQGRLVPGREPHFVSGPIAAAARSGGKQALELTAQLGVTDHAIDFRKLSLFRPGVRGMVQGAGSVTFTAQEPLFNVQLRAQNVDLEPELKRPARVTAFLNFSGSQSRYAGNLSVANMGPGWQTATLASQFQGNAEGVRLAPISGAVLDGKLSGALDVLWKGGLQVRGNLSGRGLDPAQLAAGWHGNLNLDLSGRFQKPATGEPKGTLHGKLLESRLHGQELRGQLDGSFAGQDVRIERLSLAGRGFDLRGSGELQRRVELQARVSDLSRLVPGAAGEVTADAWVRYRDGVFAGAAKGEGSGLAAAGTRVAAARFDAALGQGPGYPVHLNASLSSLRVGRLQVPTAQLTLDGTASRHALEARLAAAQAQAEITLRGGLQDGTWRGELTRFSGRDTVGPWALAAPAALVAGSSGFTVSPLVITGLPGERGELAGEFRLHPKSGDLRASWSGLDLARANAWLTGVRLVGGSAGNLTLRLLPNERLQLAARLEAHGTVVTENQRVSLERLAADLEGGAQGWRASGDIRLADAMGEGHLLFTSTRPATLALPEEGELRLQLASLDLALLRPMLRADVLLNGRVAGVVSGRLLPGRRLDLRGNVALDQGALAYRTATASFDASVVSAELAFNWHGGVADAKGGGGLLELTARCSANGSYRARGETIAISRCDLRVDADQHGSRAAFELALSGGGVVRGSLSSSAPATLGIPETGDIAMEWGGIDMKLMQPFLPAGFRLQGVVAGDGRGTLRTGRRLDLRGNVVLEHGGAAYHAEGQEFEATITTAELGFDWSGSLAAAGGGKVGGGSLELHARGAAKGSYTAKGQTIAVSRCEIGIDADRHGSRALFELALSQGGVVRGRATSSAPASLGIPETGDFAMEWGGLDPKLMQPFLPGALDIQGVLAGQARGRLLPGQRLEMTGETGFSQGKANWRGTNGEMNARIRSASLSFAWRGETLSASLNLALAEYGKARGNLVLPLPARLPIAPDRNGPVRGALSGSLRERGLLGAFMPGLVQESHGQLDLDLQLAGTWSAPQATGRLQLSKAGAYLPGAGIRVSDLGLVALLQGDQIRIENLSATSGPGRLTGNLQVQLQGWQIAGYSGSISGERFQTLYLPELQMLTSPQLSFRGDSKTVSINGTVLVPQLLVAGPPARPVVGPSKDVVLEGAPPAKEKQKFPLLVEGQIHVTLGDKVEVKASGLDARLAGSLDLVLHGLDNITSRGMIRVVKGSFKAYGIDLNIVRGRVYYVDDPVDQPTLDILALRTVGDVKAGVTVGGYLRNPAIKLYSEPPMAEVDILAYVVLGHPLSSTSTDQASMVATAASSLFSLGESQSVQEQIKSRLGLSVLGLETVNPESAGLMGYQEIPVTPTGAAPQKPATTQSLLTVGKYLTPKLYLSYGRSLVTGGSLFMLRYDIFKHWQVETQSGTESGADLYYKLEFD